MFVVHGDNKERLKDILKEVHALETRMNPRVEELRKEAYDIIKDSNMSYRDLYVLFKEYSTNKREFNIIMRDIRKTFL